MFARLLAPSLLCLAATACGSAGSDSTVGTGDTGDTGDTGSSSAAVTPTTGGGSTSADKSDDSSSAPADSSSSATATSDTTSDTGDTGAPVTDEWLHSFGAPDAQRPGGLGFTASGELWVAGDVLAAIDLGAGELSGEGSGVYLARYAVDGAALHAAAAWDADGQPTFTTVSGLAVDGTGAVVVTGWLEGTYEIGGELLVADELDVFVGKWDAAGAPVWGRRFGAADWQVGHAVAVGPDDSVWVAGAALAPFFAGDIELSGTASTGMFLVRLGSDGTPEYGRWWGDVGDQEARAVAVCADGSIALAGFFGDPLPFGPDEAVSAGGKDMFVARLDPAGEPQWIRGLGGPGTDVATHVACADALVFAGSVDDAATIGDLELDPAGDSDAVLGRFDPSGALTWAAAATGPDNQSPGGLAVAPGGDVLASFTSTGTTTLGELELAGAGDRDVVLARYTPPALSPSVATSLGDAARQTAGPVAVHPSGAAALAASHAGAATWADLPAVAATGPEDLLLLRWRADP